MSSMQTNMFVHIYILPHHQSFPPSPSTYHTLPLRLCLPNPSPTPVQVQLKPCLTHASTKGPTQTNWRPKEPSTRQSKQTMTMTTRTSQATNKKQWMGWRMTPQHREAVDKGVPWKKAPPRRYIGHDRCRSCPNSFVCFFFVFMITYRFFTGKLPMIGLEMMWNSPHKGMPGTIGLWMTGNSPHKGTPGTIVMIVPYIFFFFFFLNTYCLFTGKLPTFRLMMTWNHPHKGTPGMIIVIVPFFLSFFWILTLFTGRLPMFMLMMTWNCPHQGMLGTIVMIMPFFFILFYFIFQVLTVFLQGNCPRLGSQWHGTVLTKVHRAQLLQYMPFFLFSNSYCFFLQENNPWSGLWWCGTVPTKVCWAWSL